MKPGSYSGPNPYLSLERNTPWWAGLLAVFAAKGDFKAFASGIADAVQRQGGLVTQQSSHGRNMGLTVSLTSAPGGTGHRRCPACAEQIRVDARLCRHCRYRLTEQEIEAARVSLIAVTAQRTAQITAVQRQSESERIGRKGLICSVFGWILVAFWGLCVLANFGAFASGSKDQNGQPMSFGAFLFGLVCFSIPFGVPGFLLLFQGSKYKTASRLARSGIKAA